MPELPEVRVHAERLSATHAGAVLARFEALAFTALKTADPSPSDAVGSTLTAVTSRGKFLRLALGDIDFIIHLMQGGRLSPDLKLSPKARNGLARWRFEEHDALLLTEAGKEHRAGVWTVAGGEDAAPMEHLGPEADTVTRAELSTLLRATTGRVHGWLRDQRQLAGIGRRLANEICWTARVSPFAAVNKLDDGAVDRLHAAIRSCIEGSIADERTRDHMAKSAARLAAVHHREGEACPRCGDVVRAVEYNAYTVNYCATCQTAGKVLADNTTSKFLK